MCFFFFFQAEDGIRDWSVTGVQTCALPISEVEDEAGLDHVLGRLEVAVDRDLQRGADFEVGALAATLGEARLQMLAPGLLEGVDAEEDRDPPVADLGGHFDRFAPDRADEDGDPVALGMEVELQRLSLAAG